MTDAMMIVTAGIVLLGLSSGVVVVLADPKALDKRYYFLLAVLLVGFSVTNLMTDITWISEQVREFALRMNFSLGPLSAMVFYLFINKFTENKISNKFWKLFEKLLFLVVFLVPVFAFWGNLLIKDVYLMGNTQVFTTNELDNINVIATSILVVSALYTLISKYYYSKGKERSSLGYLVFGATIAGGVNLVIQVLQRLLISQEFVGGHEVLAVEILPAISRSSFIVFFVFCSYAILRYQMFGIRVVLEKVLTWFGIAIFFFGAFYATIWFEQQLFDSIFVPIAIILNIFVVLSLAMIFSLYEKQLHRFVRAKFMFISYDIEDVRLELTERLNTQESTAEKLSTFSSLVSEVFKIEKVGCVLYGAEFDEPITSWFGYSQDEVILLENEKLINSLIENVPERMLHPDQLTGVNKEILAVLRTTNTIGLGQYKDGDMEAVFSLGSKDGGKTLSSEDRQNIDLLVETLFEGL